jgi:hypothetical protein
MPYVTFDVPDDLALGLCEHAAARELTVGEATCEALDRYTLRASDADPGARPTCDPPT